RTHILLSYCNKTKHRRTHMTTITRWNPYQGLTTFQEQMNRLLEGSFRGRTDESNMTTWAPAVDIYETENELVLKADLPDIKLEDIEVRVENQTLTLKGERKFEKDD